MEKVFNIAAIATIAFLTVGAGLLLASTIYNIY
jgi:hypothetical protein